MEFFRQNLKWLLAPFLLCVASGFGQTFFIALFGEPIRAEFGLSHGGWGGIYAIGTLASALAVMRFGEKADVMPAQRLATFILALFCLFALFMAINPALVLLPLIIFGLRFCGQGMLTHLSQVVTARWFERNRAKAMALTSLGVAFSEAVFPALFVLIIASFGWRMTWLIAALCILALLIIIRALLAEKRTPQSQSKHQSIAGMDGREWTRSEMLHNRVFWLAIPALIVVPFSTTIFFFQIPVLASSKGWTLASIAILIPISTFSSLIGLIGGGTMIDRLGLPRIMPFIFMPAFLGYIVIASTNSLIVLPIGLALAGLTQGLNAAVSGVFWPVFYGTKNLGAIRAVGTSVMVFSTAIGPFLSGFLLDQNIAYNTQLLLLSLYAMISALLFLLISLRETKRLRKAHSN